jgi:hypothetical protein
MVRPWMNDELARIWKEPVTFTLQQLYLSEDRPPVPLHKRLSGPQNGSGRCKIQKNLCPFPGIELRPPSPHAITLKLNSVALVRERTISSERPPIVGVVPTFADRGCQMVSVTDPYSRIFSFLDRSHYCFF